MSQYEVGAQCPCMKRANEDDECWRSHLDLLLDVVMSSSEGLLDAKLGQLDVNDALVVQLLDMLLSKVAAVVGMLLLVCLNVFLPSRLVSCTENSRAMSCCCSVQPMFLLFIKLHMLLPMCTGRHIS